MDREHFSSSASGDQRYLQVMMDIFSKATGLNVVAVDLGGNTFLSSEDYSQVGFCQYIKRNLPGGCEKCRKTYYKACREAFRWNEPYFFTCHAGLVMWAVPIVMNQVHIGAMICGQVLLWETDELFFEELEQFHTGLPRENLSRLEQEAKKLKVISVKQCQSSANLLSVIVKYMANACDSDLMEQKSLMEWRHVIQSRLEEQTSALAGETFDFSVYLKRERRFLQALRMADKEKSTRLIPSLFTDIEMLSNHNLDKIRQMLEDLVTLSSRALMEAGIETDPILSQVQEYRKGLKEYLHSEELFRYTYQLFGRLLDSAYLRVESPEHNSIIKNVQKYVEDHYSEKLTTARIAASVSLSPSYLSALFKEKMHLSIHDYLIRVRIEKSIELMANRDLSIKEIMVQCGIESQSYYNKVFKKFIGVTPGRYRNRLL